MILLFITWILTKESNNMTRNIDTKDFISSANDAGP